MPREARGLGLEAPPPTLLAADLRLDRGEEPATSGDGPGDRTHPAAGSGRAYDRYPVRFRGQPLETPRYRRQDLESGQRIKAPCIIDEASCTTVVPDGWVVTSEPKGWLAIRRER